jgi:hypothetical protein
MTAPIAVSFHDPDEFLAELRLDEDRIDRDILRITVRRRYGNPFVTVSVVATATIEGTLVKVEVRIGEAFAGDEQASGIAQRTTGVLAQITEGGKSLVLEIRAGVYAQTIDG